MTARQSGFSKRFATVTRATARVALAAGMALLPLLSAGVAHGQSFSIVYNFGSVAFDGSDPQGSLIVDSAGNLYGENVNGGLYGWGAIYELPAAGGETVYIASPEVPTVDSLMEG